jgi:hypothetical protein
MVTKAKPTSLNRSVYASPPFGDSAPLGRWRSLAFWLAPRLAAGLDGQGGDIYSKCKPRAHSLRSLAFAPATSYTAETLGEITQRYLLKNITLSIDKIKEICHIEL